MSEVFATMNGWEIFGYVCMVLYVAAVIWLFATDEFIGCRRGR